MAVPWEKRLTDVEYTRLYLLRYAYALQCRAEYEGKQTAARRQRTWQLLGAYVAQKNRHPDGGLKSRSAAFRFTGPDAFHWANVYAETFPNANIKVIALRGSGRRRG